MAADLHRGYVIDVESTCWETRDEQGDRPNEIIEIGICELDLRTFAVSNIASYLVKPQFTDISPFCTELTGWTPEDVATAGDLRSALEQIGLDYGMTNDEVWFSFGGYDQRKLSSDPNMKGGAHDLYSITYRENPIARLRSHFNIKTLMAIRERTKEMGMARALKFYGETLDGRHHNGADDAANIAKIVRRVLS